GSLLIASYALLIHGGGKHKPRANVHYVILNLAGSALFLFALGIIYGTFGTLNMADLQQKAAHLPATDVQLAKAGAMLLLVVFGMKSRSEEHTSELQSRENLVCRLLLEKKKKQPKERLTKST